MPSTRRTPPARAARPRNTRPGARVGGARARHSAPEGGDRPRLTSRAAVLVVVAAVLLVSYASSTRAYLRQRDEINGLSSQIATTQRQIEGLEREKRRWGDPGYVEAQARARFGWVLPGEVAYQVLDQDGKPLTPSDQLSDPDSVAPPVPTAWWFKTYDTLKLADHPRRTPTPAGRIRAPASLVPEKPTG